MRRKKKNPDALMDLFQKAAEDAGITLNVSKKDLEETGDDQPLARKIQGEAIVQTLEYAMHSMTKRCQNCGEIFKTTYYYDGFCSYLCTEQYLREQYGFAYSGSRPIEERWSFQHWRMTPPMKMNSNVLATLEQFAHSFLADLEEFRRAEGQTESQQTEVTSEPASVSTESEQPTEHPEYLQEPPKQAQKEANPLEPLDIELPSIDLSF